jgi:hypothetical protein
MPKVNGQKNNKILAQGYTQPQLPALNMRSEAEPVIGQPSAPSRSCAHRPNRPPRWQGCVKHKCRRNPGENRSCTTSQLTASRFLVHPPPYDHLGDAHAQFTLTTIIATLPLKKKRKRPVWTLNMQPTSRLDVASPSTEGQWKQNR